MAEICSACTRKTVQFSWSCQEACASKSRDIKVSNFIGQLGLVSWTNYVVRGLFILAWFMTFQAIPWASCTKLVIKISLSTVFQSQVFGGGKEGARYLYARGSIMIDRLLIKIIKPVDVLAATRYCVWIGEKFGPRLGDGLKLMDITITIVARIGSSQDLMKRASRLKSAT